MNGHPYISTVTTSMIRKAALATVLLLPAIPTATADGPAVTWMEPVEVAAGRAYAGPWRMNESEFLYVDDPSVALNERGDIGVVWADQSRRDLFFQRFNPEGETQLGAPVNISRSPDIFSWLPRIIITDNDPARVYVLWQEIVFSGGTHGGEAFFARSTDGGESFTDPINLSRSMAGDGKGRLAANYWHNGSLDLAMDKEGRLYAAWTEYDGRLWLSRSTDRGESFTEPLHVAGNDQRPARGPALATTTNETVYLAWTVGENIRANIHFARSTDAGRSFSPPRPVAGSTGHADAPKLAVDDHRTLHLVYGESPDGPLRSSHIRYTRSGDHGDTFEPPREIARPQDHDAAGIHFPALGLDGRDNLYVSWEIYPVDPKGRSRGLGFTYSNNNGRTFMQPINIPGTGDPRHGVNGSRQGLLMQKLAVNRTGAIAVVNSTFRNRDTSRIWLIRGK